MKTSKPFLPITQLIGAVALAIAPTTPAATLIPVSTVASTEYPGRPATNLIDGSGLTGGDDPTGTQGADVSTMWNSTQNDDNASVTFDLGGLTDVSAIRLWNFNESPSLRGFGIKDVEVFAGSDVGSMTSRGTISFNIASGTEGDPSADYDVTSLGLTGVQFIRFVVLNNQAGATFNSAGNSSGNVADLDSRRVAGMGEIRFISPTIAGPYSLWATANELTGDDALPDADPDDDGLENALEFVLGSNPWKSDNAGFQPQLATHGGSVTFTFSRSTASTLQPVGLVVQVSPDLATWNPADEIPIGATSGTGPNGVTYTVTADGDFDTIVVTIPQDIAKKFARLKAAL